MTIEKIGVELNRIALILHLFIYTIDGNPSMHIGVLAVVLSYAFAANLMLLSIGFTAISYAFWFLEVV